MRPLLALLFAVLLAVPGRGQERHVRVQLESGETIEGTVLTMDLATLQVRVDGVVRTIDATRIRSCRFEEPPAPAGETPDAQDPPSADPAAPAAAAPPQDPPPAAAAAEPSSKVTWKGPLPDPADPAAADQLPHDVRHRSLFRQRVERLDEAYPWLQSSQPVQWISLSLLLGILMSLTVHMSVNVAGAEGASMGRSFGMALWYLLTGLLQMAMVPCNHFTVVLMLLANPTLALFWLSGLFGLTRVAATIAFATQLGFVVVGYGVVELVTAILASVGAPAA